MININIRKKPVIIILSIIVLVVIVIIGVNTYQAKNEFRLGLKDFPEDKRLSEIDDLNTLLEPNEQTFKLLKRWELVHQVEPDYPYPATEIEEQDWMGMNYFLYGDLDDEDGAAKAEMIYDENNNIDRDVYDYIGTGDASSDHPVIQEVEKRIENNK